MSLVPEATPSPEWADYVDVLCACLPDYGPFEVGAPHRFTVKTEHGYRKQGFIGGEKLKPTGAYIGKKHTILTFEECIERRDFMTGDSIPPRSIEMTVEEAHFRLVDFEVAWREIETGIEDIAAAEVHADAVKRGENSEEYNQAKAANMPHWGSW